MSDGPAELEFDHKEDLLSRLADLVRGYPVGLGLVKEFLQNADDAGASWLRVIYDKSQHPGSMPRKEQLEALGPALFFVNDKVFSDLDFGNIQSIGGRGKLKDAGRTGRFGQGFSTSFSVSDQPTLLTGDRVAWFDPHQRAHPGKNARAWLLANVAQHWPDWAATFQAAGWSPGTPSFSGSAFRLPIRSESAARRSQIRDVPFTDESFETVLQEVKAAGPTLLVFLRSVQELLIEEIERDGTRRLRYRLSTKNKDNVEGHRARLRASVKGDPVVLLAQWLEKHEELIATPFEHSFQIECGDGAQEHERWAVVTGLFRGHEDILLKKALAICSRQEKALPWAGAAVSLSSSSKAPGGGLACFLPLPKPASWPVWLHGWFDLDSNRRDITRTAGTDEVDRLRMEWNKLLLLYAVGEAWTRLLAFVQEEPSFAANPYRLWPQRSAAQDEYEKALVQGFFKSAGHWPILKVVGPKGQGWQKLPAPHVDHVGAAYHAELREPLLAAGRTLFDPPLPLHLVEALKDGGFPVEFLTPRALAKIVSSWASGVNAPFELTASLQPALRKREWVLALARLISQDNKELLKGLPLALLADGRLHTFGKCGPIYVMTLEQRELFASLSHRMLDLEFQGVVGINDSVAALGVHTLDLDGATACVQEVCKQQIPDQQWIARVYDYLERIPRDVIQRCRSLVQALPIVPGEKNSWHKMGGVETPSASNGLSSELREALGLLKMPLLSGSEELIRAIEEFRKRHSGFIEDLSPDRLATVLSAHVSRPSLNNEALRDQSVVTAILDYLSPPSWLRSDDVRREYLRRLPMFPAIGGAILAADTKGICYLSDFELPADLGIQQQVLETGQDGRWKPLLCSLEVDEQNAFNFVTKALLPSFSNSQAVQQDLWLRWLRDNLQTIYALLPEHQRQSLRSALRGTAILPVRGGQLREARRIYRPDSEDTIRLLGDVALTPDADRFDDQPELWKKFFIELDLNLQPLPEDLLESVRTCADEANKAGTAAVKARLVALFEHITENWDRLGNPQKSGTQKFADALSRIPWLFACQYDLEDVPAAKIWPDRLYKGSELSPQRHRNLLASIRPILYGKEPPAEVLAALGMPLQLEFGDVMNHFAAVRSSPLPIEDDAKHRDALRNACVAFLEHLGGLGDAVLRRSHNKLATLMQEPCIYLRSRWWMPSRVFLETIPLSSTWLVSICEDANIASRPAARTGLLRLQVRAKPDHSDWVALLQHWAGSLKDEPASESVLQEAYAALQQLRSADSQWLRTHDVRVPTQDNKLVLAREAFLADDSRLKTQTAQSYVPLVSDAEEAQDVGLRAGASSLLASLQEQLMELPLLLDLGEDAEWAADCVKRIQSPAFGLCLRRIALHEAIATGNDKRQADARSGEITDCDGLDVLVTARLTVKSILSITGQVVFVDPNAAGFLDAGDGIIWLRQGSRRAMNGELVRAISRHTGIADTLRLRDLLDTDPDYMESLLNEEGVAMLTQGGTGWRLAEPPAEYDDSIDVESDGAQAHPPSGNGGPWRSGAGGGAGAGTPSPEAPGASPQPGDGSSNPWTPEREWSGGGSEKRRMRSYSHPAPQQDYDTGPVDGSAEGGATDLQLLARTKVRKWEEQRGRLLVAENPPFSDFDLLTGEGDGRRFIKVKALVGPWSVRGVALSRSQAEAARLHGREWWLYVVEFAQDPSRARVLPVLNPVVCTDELRFDDGWSALAEEQEVVSIPRPGMRVQLDDGRPAMVLEVEDCAPFYEVTLLFDDGTEEQLTWQQRWIRSK